MSNKKSGSRHNKAPFDGLPSPLKVAARYARVTGEEALNPTKPFRLGRVIGAGYAVQKENAADQAAVFLRREHPRHGSELVFAFIGHRDPANADWNLYPEYVRQSERAALSKFVEKTGQQAAREMLEATADRERAIDGRHPITRRVRGEMGALLGGLSLQDILHRSLAARGEQQQVEVDAMTTYHPSITSGVYGPTHLLGTGNVERQDFTVVPGQVFRICYVGTKHILDDRHTNRGLANATIAKRSDEGIWIPELDVVTMDEWDALAPVPDTLEQYGRQFSAFSVDACAIAHNYGSI